MKPKSKHNHLVVKLYQEIPPIPEKTIQWGYQKLFQHYVHMTSKYYTCMDCGHRWEHKGEYNLKKRYITSCPECNQKLEKWPSKERTNKTQRFFQKIESFKGQQVIRVMCMTKKEKVCLPADFEEYEIIQHWISPKGQYSVFAYCGHMGWSYYQWYSEMDLRSPKDKYFVDPVIAPGRKIISNVKRNGYNHMFYDYNPALFIKEILGNSRFETLIKLQQHHLATYSVRHPALFKKRWPQVKIALRRNYRYFDEYQSTVTWFDHLDYLKYFKKDLNNPKFICPSDLNGEHQKLYEKKRKIENEIHRQRLIEIKLQRKIQLKKDDQDYQKSKGRYLDFHIQTEKFYIEPLKSIAEFYQEGEDMHHCIYSNHYYGDKNKLILSAKLYNGERLETIEYSLTENKVLQSRSRYNETSEYHDQIVELMNSSTNQIKQLEYVRRSKTKHERNVESYTALAEV